jgi:hypothetical protein
LLLPVPTFLQHLPAERYDLLVLKDPGRNCYAKGIPGISGGFLGLTRKLESMIDRSAYRSVVSYGASGGGLAALNLAAKLQLDKGVSVGTAGRNYESPRTRALIELLDISIRKLATANLLIVYGLDFDLDREAALSLDNQQTIRTLGVRARRGQITHNPLYPLLREGKLGTFLQTALDPLIKGYADAAGNPMDVLVTRTAWRPRALRSSSLQKQLMDYLTKRAKSSQLPRSN